MIQQHQLWNSEVSLTLWRCHSVRHLFGQWKNITDTSTGHELGSRCCHLLRTSTVTATLSNSGATWKSAKNPLKIAKWRSQLVRLGSVRMIRLSIGTLKIWEFDVVGTQGPFETNPYWTVFSTYLMTYYFYHILTRQLLTINWGLPQNSCGIYADSKPSAHLGFLSYCGPRKTLHRTS